MKELSEEHKKALTSIRQSTNEVIHRINLLRPENRKNLGKKDMAKICNNLVKNYILPMENIMCNLYIEKHNLRDFFDTEKKD